MEDVHREIKTQNLCKQDWKVNVVSKIKHTTSASLQVY